MATRIAQHDLVYFKFVFLLSDLTLNQNLLAISSVLYSNPHVYFMICTICCLIPFLQNHTRRPINTLFSDAFPTAFEKKWYHSLLLRYLLQILPINSVNLQSS